MNLFERKNSREKLDLFREITLNKNLFNPVQSFSAKLGYESAEFIRAAWEEILKERQLRENIALYFHIPFCKDSRCSYCMYYSQVISQSAVPEYYLNYLVDEFTYFLPVMEDITFKSLYIGGGTPSLLTDQQLSDLFHMLDPVKFDEKAEKCVEQSFNTTSKEKLFLLKQLGINRLSFGVQSLEPLVLANVNRVLSELSLIRNILKFGRELGYRELNVDLMIGLPGETKKGITDAIGNLIDSGADCITVYIFRHLKEHLYTRDAIGHTDLHQYNSEYIPSLLKDVRNTVQKSGWVDTVNDNRTEYQFFTSEQHWNSYDLTGYRTQPDITVGNSVIGFGHTAYSYVQDFFRYENRQKKKVFASERSQYVFDMVSARDRQQVFVLDRLANYGFVDMTEFRKYFHEDFLVSFNQEVIEISSLNMCRIENRQFRLDSSDRIETAALSKFFWNPDYLASMIK
jgi:coproporphyrinogen III oxidase-like Fe-S oxidoreductase